MNFFPFKVFSSIFLSCDIFFAVLRVEQEVLSKIISQVYSNQKITADCEETVKYATPLPTPLLSTTPSQQYQPSPTPNDALLGELFNTNYSGVFFRKQPGFK